MTSRINEAVARKQSGQYNCAQAVACAYADVAGVDETTLFNASAAFGGGMGCMEGTCGAIVGAGIVLGHLHKDRALAMRSMKGIVKAFQQRNGGTVCRYLKGLDTPDRQPRRACDDCVADACELLEKEL